MGRYILKRTTDQQYMFNLKAANNETILTSERYTTKAGAENGIASVRENSPKDERYLRKKSTSGKHYFVLTAPNNQTIGTSELYSGPVAMEAGIASVKVNGPHSPVQEET